ncbi:MAG: hypothetical protein WBD55_04145 [Dehalococcoidia bacterium]
MRHSGKFLVSALMIALVLVLGAATASASSGVELRPLEGELGRVRADSRALTFTDEERTAEIVCEVRRTLSLHRTIAKTAGALAGFVTAVDVRNCRGGTARILRETLPWHIRYVSFNGTLPNIRSIRLALVGTAFLVEAAIGFVRCLYSGTAEGTATVDETLRIRSIAADENVLVPLFRRLGGVFCAANGVFRGVLEVIPPIHVRLI